MRPERRHEQCLNCGAPTPGDFCSACGQRNADLHASFGELAVDLLGEAFEADSRLLRTIRPFLLQPGFLTQEHNAGKRVRYSSPLRLYLFCSFAFFLSVSLSQSTGPTFGSSGSGFQIGWQAGEGPDGGRADAGPAALADGGLDDDRPIAELVPDAGPAHVTGLGPLNHRLEERIEDVRHMRKGQREQFSQRLGADFLSNFPKAVFLLLPLFALLLKLLFWRSGKFYVEHLTFAFHVHAFAFLLLLVPVALQGRSVAPFFILGIPVYVVLALRRVYGGGWWQLAAKSFLLALSYLVLVTAAIALTVVSGILLL